MARRSPVSCMSSTMVAGFHGAWVGLCRATARSASARNRLAWTPSTDVFLRRRAKRATRQECALAAEHVRLAAAQRVNGPAGKLEPLQADQHPGAARRPE